MLTAASMYGCTPIEPPAVGAQPTAHMAPSTIPTGLGGLLSPRNPMMWLGVILLATVGAAGVAGSVRLGPAKVSGGIGKA